MPPETPERDQRIRHRRPWLPELPEPTLEQRLKGLDASELSSPPRSLRELSVDLERTPASVRRQLERLGIPALDQGTDQEGPDRFPGYAQALLREEYEWSQRYSRLPSHLNVTQLAELAGRSREFIDTLIADINPPRIVPTDAARIIPLYPKELLRHLRGLDTLVPASGDWVTAHQVAEYVGRRNEWVHDQLVRLGVEGEPRRSSLNGNIHIHYPPQSVELVQEIIRNLPPPGGDWVTLNYIKFRTGRSLSWVQRRIGRYADQAQLRIDDRDHINLHYPPSVLQELLDESDEMSRLEPKGDRLSPNEVARAVGRTVGEVMYRMHELQVPAEERLDSMGRRITTFPPWALQHIKEAVSGARHRDK